MSVEKQIIAINEAKNAIGNLVNFHIENNELWYPHEYIPWGQGENYAKLGGKDWEHSDIKLKDSIRDSLIIGFISEENLPNYFHKAMYSSSRYKNDVTDMWYEWFRTWTAEESRHGTAIRDYLIVTRNADPVELENERISIVKSGYHPYEHVEPFKELVYACMQELATRISHRNTGKLSGDPVLEKMMTRISKDENYHMIFYRDTVNHLLDVEPDLMVQSIVDTMTKFEMPGKVIKNFYARAILIALEGVYDLKQHKEKIIMPLINYWKIFDRSNLNSESYKSLEYLKKFLKNLDDAIEDFEYRKQEYFASSNLEV